jgi:hypothetical protein
VFNRGVESRRNQSGNQEPGSDVTLPALEGHSFSPGNQEPGSDVQRHPNEGVQQRRVNHQGLLYHEIL